MNLLIVVFLMGNLVKKYMFLIFKIVTLLQGPVYHCILVQSCSIINCNYATVCLNDYRICVN